MVHYQVNPASLQYGTQKPNTLAESAVTEGKLDKTSFPAIVRAQGSSATGPVSSSMNIPSNGVVIAFGVVRKGPSGALSGTISVSGTAHVANSGTASANDAAYATMPAIRFIQVQPGTLNLSMAGSDNLSIAAIFIPVMSSTLA